MGLKRDKKNNFPGDDRSLGTSAACPTQHTSPPALPAPHNSSEKGEGSEGAARQADCCQAENQCSLVPAVPLADVQSRLGSEEPSVVIWQNSAQISVLTTPLWALKGCFVDRRKAKPVQQLTLLGSSYYGCWWGGREDLQTEFLRLCPHLCYAQLKFSALLPKHRRDSLVHCSGIELINQGQDHPADLLSTENNQEGQWGGGSWQEKEGTSLNIPHFNRARNG